MKNKNQKESGNKKSLLLLLLLVLGITVGYAAIATTLKINGTSKVKKATWDVHWDNVQVTEGSVKGDAVTKAATIKEGDTTEVEYEVTLNEPGDFYEFTVDAVNNGTIDAMIAEGGITTEMFEDVDSSIEELPKYVKYTVTDSKGSALKEKQLLSKKTGESPTKMTYKVRVEYREDINPEDLPSDADKTLNFKFSVNYVQADDTAVSE